MKIYVKNLRGTHFQIEVKPEDAVADVKKNIESAQGSDVYPAARQMLIHQGKVLKDGTTLEENNVAEESCVVIMLTKSKSPSGEGSTASTAATAKAPQSSAPAPAPVTAQASPITQSPVAQVPAPLNPVTTTHGTPPAGASVPSSTIGSESNIYGQAASTLVAGTNLEGSIQQLLDMGGGTWDRDTVVRALRAAYNNPERAVEYLYSGIPQSTEAPTPTVSRAPPAGQTTTPAARPPPSGPNANPLDLFPQGVPPSLGSNLAGANNLDFLRNSNQFQALRAMVQANPQILQPMLQELRKQNPQLVRLIQEHQADFLRLLNEPLEGGGGGGAGNALRELAEAMPQSIQVTPEEREAIGRLEAMGFDRALVLEVFFACNKNEELAANYLLDHSHEFED